jgi:hypothetical protein
MISKYFDRANSTAKHATRPRRIAGYSTLIVLVVFVVLTWNLVPIWLYSILAGIDFAIFAFLGNRWADKDAYLKEHPGPGY